ncbi:MAG: translocation/assembly module TamB domain-containing protein, partial [Rhizobacter sp.]
EAVWSGGVPRATVQPGRAELLGGAVRWSRIAWQAAAQPGGFAQIEAEADLEPLRLAPLLARAQPDFGWGGDLTIAGHVKLRSAPAFSADVVIERSAGDLSVTDEIGTRPLGLTDLRFGLNAENGTWSFTQGLAGKALGVVAGAEVVRTSPQATWPAADAPLTGVLELRVDDLGTWGNWVPPGWRLGGALHTSASFGGRFGAPEYTGEIEGSRLAIRNFLQGVNVSDGDVAIQLKGGSAHIERFTAKAGGGSVRLEGDMSLGEAPKAVLKLTADKFQLLGRVDRRIVVSGAGQLQLDRKTLAFDGQFDVDEGLIDFTRSDAPSLSDDVLVVRAKDAPSPAAAASAAASP